MKYVFYIFIGEGVKRGTRTCRIFQLMSLHKLRDHDWLTRSGGVYQRR